MAADPITGVLNLGGKFLDKFVKDKDLSAKLEHDEEMQGLHRELSQVLGQLEINKAEAQHASVFISGWRPATGWICAVALGYAYVVYPLLRFIVVILMDNPPELPSVGIAELMPVLLGMLGLGSLRTYEKASGKARRNLSE